MKNFHLTPGRLYALQEIVDLGKKHYGSMPKLRKAHPVAIQMWDELQEIYHDSFDKKNAAVGETIKQAKRYAKDNPDVKVSIAYEDGARYMLGKIATLIELEMIP